MKKQSKNNNDKKVMKSDLKMFNNVNNSDIFIIGNNLDNAIKEKKLDMVMINFSKLCSFININNLSVIEYKRLFYIIIEKTKQIKIFFEEVNDPKKIINLIYIIKNNVLSQIYLSILLSQIILDEDNFKPEESEELINILINSFSSLFSLNDNCILVIFFASYYTLINMKKIFMHSDTEKICEFLKNVIIYMNKDLANYYYHLLDNIKINKENDLRSSKKSENVNLNILYKNELYILYDLLKESLTIIKTDLINVDKDIYHKYILDSFINCILTEKDGKSFYNKIFLEYILENITNEELIDYLDKIFSLLSKIKNEPNILSIINQIIAKLYLYFVNQINNEEIIKKINISYKKVFNNIIKISKEKINLKNINLTFYFGYIKNILLFTIQIYENISINELTNSITTLLNILLIFIKNSKNLTFNDEDFIIFNLILKKIKESKIGFFPFTLLLDIISFFPKDKKNIKYHEILEEINNSNTAIDNNKKLNFSITLIKNILSGMNNNLNGKETIGNISIKEYNNQIIAKINKLLSLINSDNPSDIIQLIALLGQFLSSLNNSQRAFMCDSFYKKIIYFSEKTIEYYISKKSSNINNASKAELNLAFSIIVNIYSLTKEYITIVFSSLFDYNKKLILECILIMDRIKDEELKEKLAYIAVYFGKLYINIVFKEISLENEKGRIENDNYIDLDESDFGFKVDEDEMKKRRKFITDYKKKRLSKKISKEYISNKDNHDFEPFSLMIYSIDKFIEVFKRTNIFHIEIEKKLIINGISEINNDNSDKKDNEKKEEKKVPGYTILIEELSKIKGKRIDSILIKLYFVDIYYQIKNNQIMKNNLNTLFLDIKTQLSFLNNDNEICYIISRILDKILWLIINDKNILEKDTIDKIEKFINERIDKYKKINKCDKDLEKNLDIINDKNNKLIEYLNEENNNVDNVKGKEC